MREIATGRFIANGEAVLFLGPPGVGKTHLAIALGRAAVEAGYTVLFTTATALLADLVDGQSKGSGGGDFYYQRFTPRGKRSVWSKINRAKALELIKAAP